MTRDNVVFIYGHRPGIFVSTIFRAMLTPGMETAAGRKILRICDITRNGEERVSLFIQIGKRAKQPPGIGMDRGLEYFPDGSIFNDSSGIHHRDALTQLGNNPQVMGNHKQRGIHLRLQFLHQLQDLRLNRNIQSGRRFIRN